MTNKDELRLFIGRENKLKTCFSKLIIKEKEIGSDVIGQKILDFLLNLEGEQKKEIETKIYPLCFSAIFPYLQKYGVPSTDCIHAAIIGFFLRDWIYENNAEIKTIILDDDPAAKEQEKEIRLRIILEDSQTQTGNIFYGIAVALEEEIIDKTKALEILNVFLDPEQNAEEVLELIEKIRIKFSEKFKETEN